MKFEQATLALKPRTLSQCLDLATVLLREHAAPLLKLWALVSIPSCLLVYMGVYYAEFNLWLALFVFWLATAPLGMLMAAAAAPSAFGEVPTVRGTLRHLGFAGWLLLLKLLGLRLLALLGGAVCLVPGLWLPVRTGFLTEQAVLSRLDRHLADRRVSELVQGEVADLMLRGGAIAGYCGMLWMVLFVTLDLLCWSLSFPLLIGRIIEGIDVQYEDAEQAAKAVFRFVTTDAVAISALLAVALAVYPLGRLAWLLCYIDLRVRRDCWDMELEVLQEARRLENT